MSRKSRLLPIAALAALTSSGFAADPLQMEIAPAFEGYGPPFGTAPIAVDLHNDGADARGVLRVSSGNYQMDYPVELPRGSDKRLLTFPSIDYGGVRYILITDQGRLLKEFSPPPTTDAEVALLISDTPGEMSFLKGNDPTNSREEEGGSSRRMGNSRIQDAYCRPTLAPTRPIGYANLGAVVLGTGSERLNDEQVQALKLYVLTGGTVVFVGGASSPTLTDSRWREMLPVQGLRSVTLNNSEVLERLGGTPPPTVTVTTGQPVPSAVFRKEGDATITAERVFGLGRVVFLAFNPFEAPLSKWEGRKDLTTRSIRLMEALRATSFLDAYSQTQQSYGTYPAVVRTMPARRAAPSAYMATTGPSAGDPFSTKLPPSERIFTLLGAYFVVVVPLNFLVLKKLKRGELAWFTAPIVSLGFAAAFFGSAQGLYSAKMSSAARGILVMQEGMDDGVFVGQTQLFVPNAGTYDLKMKGVDSLGIAPPRGMYGYYPRSGNDAEFDPIDVGEIQVPKMQANNLAFRQISYRQRVSSGGWLSVSTKKEGDVLRISVRNSSPYDIHRASVWVGEAGTELGDLASGAAKTVNAAVPADEEPPGQGTLGDFLSRSRSIGVSGSLVGFRPGPQLGAEVEDRTNIEFAYVSKEALGPK